MTKSGPSQNPSLFNAFYDFEAPQKNETQPGAEAAFAAACAIGAFIGLYGQNRIYKNSASAWVQI
jgi:hypothetical protein